MRSSEERSFYYYIRRGLLALDKAVSTEMRFAARSSRLLASHAGAPHTHSHEPVVFSTQAGCRDDPRYPDHFSEDT